MTNLFNGLTSAGDRAVIGNSPSNPYFYLTLAQPVTNIKAVLLTPRNDAWYTDLTGVTVTLSDSSKWGQGTIKTCATGVRSPAAGVVNVVDCSMHPGTYRYIGLERPGSSQIGLGEVQVLYGGERQRAALAKDRRVKGWVHARAPVNQSGCCCGPSPMHARGRLHETMCQRTCMRAHTPPAALTTCVQAWLHTTLTQMQVRCTATSAAIRKVPHARRCPTGCPATTCCYQR